MAGGVLPPETAATRSLGDATRRATMSGMNSLRTAALLSVAFSGALLLCTPAVEAGEQTPYLRHQTEHLTATVASVDPRQRTIVLVTPSGERTDFEVGPDVKNFSQIKPGDRVMLNYYVGIAFQLRPPGTSAEGAMTTEQLQSAPEGARPGRALTRTYSTTVKVESVDPASNHITVKRADGTVLTVAVQDPQAQQRVRKLKPGDAIGVTYTEQLAVSVQPVLR
jgi:hypothetical protein